MVVQMEQDCAVSEAVPHLVNIGKMVEEMENKIRSSLDQVYFGKTKQVVEELRSIQSSTGPSLLLPFPSSLPLSSPSFTAPSLQTGRTSGSSSKTSRRTSAIASPTRSPRVGQMRLRRLSPRGSLICPSPSVSRCQFESRTVQELPFGNSPIVTFSLRIFWLILLGATN